LFGLSFFLGNNHPGIALLPLLFVVQAIAMQVAPLKLLLNAKARYMPYAVIALLSNLGRIGAAVYFLKSGHELSVTTAAVIMLLFNAAELAATSVYLWITHALPSFRVPLRGYKIGRASCRERVGMWVRGGCVE